MKKYILVLSLMLGMLPLISSAQFGGEREKQVYKAPNFKESLKKHKIVAILPFTTTVSYKRVPKNFNPENARDEERKLATNLQQGMYTYLLRKGGKYSVTFQDVERTNILLKQAGVIDRLDEILPDSLAKILGVDAVIRCKYAYEKTGSESGAIVQTVLIGVPGKTGSGSLIMQIYDGVDGNLLWRFYKEMNENVTSNANTVMERMMRKVSRNFPYEK